MVPLSCALVMEPSARICKSYGGICLQLWHFNTFVVPRYDFLEASSLMGLGGGGLFTRVM